MKNLWSDTAAEHFKSETLATPLQADLCIVGGGFTGGSAALHAAEAGAKVVLLEGQTIGYGGSGRNVGLVNAGLWTPPDTIEQLLPDGAGAQLVRLLAGAPALVFDLIARHEIACEPVHNGTLHLAHSPAGVRDLQDRHRQQVARGAPVQLLDAKETRRRTGSRAFHGALHDPRAGTVQPLAYARGLARAAAAAGAVIHEHSPVRTITREGDRWRVATQGGEVRSRALILATNAYHAGIAGPAPGPVVPVNFFQAATKPLPASVAGSILPGGEGAWDTAMVMTSVRRDQAGRIIIGAMGSLEAPGRPMHLDWAHRKFRSYFPQLARPQFTHAWSGRIGMTSDHLPRILRFGPGGYAAFGYSGRGIAPGTFFGRALAWAALGGDEEGLPLAPITEHRDSFTGLRGAWFETGAALIHAVSNRF